jgi:hypothetical protein
MIRRRQCAAALKAQVGLERLAGAKSSVELCRAHYMASSVVAEWQAIFRRRAGLVFDSPASPYDHDPMRVAE